MEMKYSFDPKCEDLARHFMPHGSREAIMQLAQSFQDAVEAFEFVPSSQEFLDDLEHGVIR